MRFGIGLLLFFMFYGLIPRSLGDGLSPPLPVAPPQSGSSEFVQCLGQRCR